MSEDRDKCHRQAKIGQRSGFVVFGGLREFYRIVMPSDYIPSTDSEFDVWQNRFVDAADGDLGANVQALAGGLKAAQGAASMP